MGNDIPLVNMGYGLPVVIIYLSVSYLFNLRVFCNAELLIASEEFLFRALWKR